jgi:fructan beta-fructosidase
VDDIIQSDSEKHPPKLRLEPFYKEVYRPQFHFTAKKNWLNDPNGLVFADGEYHLFFQHNPEGIQWGDMHWGHAVSQDLFHWKELPIALSPTKLGTNFSGSAAIDSVNTTGFGKNGKPPLVAMYTAAGKPFTQCLVYSNDKGRNWTEYAKNPVLNHIRGENRDPRIFWHQPSHEWKMALYLDEDEFAIFGSPNLKEWRELSRLHLPGSSECPELFEIPVGNSRTKTKWVFYGANCRTLVGSFDGKTFTPETEPRMLDFGQFYASQTYNDVPNRRRIQIGWMNGPGPLPNMPFNQQMSVPSDLTLDDDNVIHRLPAKEIGSLWHNTLTGANKTLTSANRQLANLKGGLYDIDLAVQLIQITPMVIDIGGHELHIDPAAKKATIEGRAAPIDFPNQSFTVRILVDRSSVELFFNGGTVCLSAYLPASQILPNDRTVTLHGEPQNFQILWLRTSEIKSSW